MAYRCGECGFESPRWMGFCPQCRHQDGLIEVPSESATRKKAASSAVVGADAIGAVPVKRFPTGLEEVDRVVGGGLVPGAAVLLGGEPGIGKSTLLLQVAGGVAAAGVPVLVASAEESLDQIGMRAERLGVRDPGVLISSAHDVDAIISAGEEHRPALLIVDSVQTVAVPELGGTPGGVAQVREAAARLVHFAKSSGTVVMLVGHVTKDGAIAGPKVLEHMVDVVLSLEGDLDRGLRVLRSLKNRFGPAQQVGIFEMSAEGMAGVSDPGGLLQSEGLGTSPGSVVFPAVEGRRPLLVEVQALVARSPLPQPRRSAKGIEAARAQQIIAVLERHAGLSFVGHDVYVSVTGGLRLRDPGVDLAVALALASSLLDRPLGAVAAWGEVGLTGEVRSAAHDDVRAAEVERLGIGRVTGTNGRRSSRVADVLLDAGLRAGARLDGGPPGEVP